MSRPVTRRLLPVIILLLPILMAPSAPPQKTLPPPEGKMLINQTTLLPNETLNVTIMIKGYNLPSLKQPKWPEVPGFIFVDATQSVVPSRLGDNTYTIYRFIGSYIPKESGHFSLPAIEIKAPGFTFKTQPVEIKVLNPDGTENDRTYTPPPPRATPPTRAQPPAVAPGDEIRITAVPSTTTPYVGEQVVLTYRLMTNISIGQKVVQSQRPEYQHFWVEQVPRQSETPFESFVRNGTRYYQINLERLVLFPLEAGEYTIEPAEWQITAKFEKPTYHEELRHIKTKPVKLNVRPLPPADPPLKRTEIGHYQISLNHPASTVKLGQAFPLYLTIKGAGNIRGLLPPDMPTSPGFNVVSISPVHTRFSAYVDQDQDTPRPVFGGEKVWEILVYPKRLGELTFPPIHFTFFDPEKETYQTVTTQSLSVQVEKVDETTSLETPRAPQPEPTYMLPVIFFSILTCLLLAILLVLHILRRKGKLGGLGRKRATSVDELLDEAESMASHKGSAAFYDLLFSAVILMLRQSTGFSVHSMTREELSDVMRRKEFTEHEIREIIAVLDFCDEARFAGRDTGTSDRMAMLSTVRHAYQELRTREFQPNG